MLPGTSAGDKLRRRSAAAAAARGSREPKSTTTAATGMAAAGSTAEVVPLQAAAGQASSARGRQSAGSASMIGVTPSSVAERCDAFHAEAVERYLQVVVSKREVVGKSQATLNILQAFSEPTLYHPRETGGGGDRRRKGRRERRDSAGLLQTSVDMEEEEDDELWRPRDRRDEKRRRDLEAQGLPVEDMPFSAEHIETLLSDGEAEVEDAKRAGGEEKDRGEAAAEPGTGRPGGAKLVAFKDSINRKKDWVEKMVQKCNRRKQRSEFEVTFAVRLMGQLLRRVRSYHRARSVPPISRLCRCLVDTHPPPLPCRGMRGGEGGEG